MIHELEKLYANVRIYVITNTHIDIALVKLGIISSYINLSFTLFTQAQHTHTHIMYICVMSVFVADSVAYGIEHFKYWLAEMIQVLKLFLCSLNLYRRTNSC